MWNNVVNAWWPLVLYPATDAPRFHKGMIAMIPTCAATLGVTWLVWYLERREWRQKACAADADSDAGDFEEKQKSEGVADVGLREAPKTVRKGARVAPHV